MTDHESSPGHPVGRLIIIAPGVGYDAAGNLHVSVPDLLAYFRWPDDEAHRARAIAAVRDAIKSECPRVPVSEVD